VTATANSAATSADQFTYTAGGRAARLSVLPPSPDDNWIGALYQSVLGREAGPTETAWWVRVLHGAGRAAVVDGIERSPEARTDLVKGWYSRYLGRPAAGGEEQSWVRMLLAGASEEQTLAGILASPEFLAHSASLGAGRPEEQFVGALYQLLLNRTPAPAEVSGWVRELPALGRQGVALALLTSAEYRQSVVMSWYETLLDRAGAVSAAEVNSWVFANLDLLHVREGFEASAEFAALVA
jgi:hypothetical protein